MSVVQLAGSALLEAPFIIAGHGYDTGRAPRPEPRGGGGETESVIGTTSIAAVALVAVITLGVLVSLNPSAARAWMKRMAPIGVILVIIAAPLAAWSVTADDDEVDSVLVVERAKNLEGVPELLISLADEGLNSLQTTNGKTAVRIECLSRKGEVVLEAIQKWPFVITEQGFDAPHVHQATSPEQLQRAFRCRLRGTSVPLESAVKGPLTG